MIYNRIKKNESPPAGAVELPKRYNLTEAKSNILKQKVQDPHDWYVALCCFLDHFSNDGQLFKRSQKVHIPLIQQMFGELCVGVFRNWFVPLAKT